MTTRSSHSQSEQRPRRRRNTETENAGDAAVSMYQSREKIYPREISGRFQSLRKFAVFALLGLYYLLPWVQWNGRQAVLFDLHARQFHLFGITLWPQDFFYLALLLIICALGLFFVTAIAGRVWCGYACPQTVWTEVFLWMERWCEGDRPKRMKLDRGPWTGEKIARKGSKHVLWVVFALWTGFTFVAFFTPARELAARTVTLDLGGWETFWMLFYGFATWGNAGFLREQVCLYMCPYARFQSAMFDRDTMIISYDDSRGEPRGPRSRSVDPRAKGLGDCIDCTLCVQVCPTGIDIRKGLQYECIACGACVDACDHVMDRMEYPRGLIRYTTENAMEERATRVLRPRTIIYGALLTALAVALVSGLLLRTPLRLDIIPDRNALYRMTDTGAIENVYRLSVMNMDQAKHTYRFETSGLPGLTIDANAGEKVTLEPGETRNVPVRIRTSPESVRPGGNDIQVTVRSTGDPDLVVTEPTRFHAPIGR
ncbi:cytochrome c oxidase accessory protein CcoG [Arhodomonas sp. AD133]|uniref:cytochrome c oxidase accessory protein CcoG n=1 Tax=Arhodomonas sp. AD133 TaxID=3415009 RepID=UPI003EB890A2